MTQSVKTKAQKAMPRATENHLQGEGLGPNQGTGDICSATIQKCYRPHGYVPPVLPLCEWKCILLISYAFVTMMC